MIDIPRAPQTERLEATQFLQLASNCYGYAGAMKNIIAASILGVCLIVAAFIFSGRYYVIAVDKGVAVRVDRWTGKTETIRTNTEWWEEFESKFQTDPLHPLL